MNNIKSISMANDGAMKRLAITYDVIDEDGKAVNANKKINRLVTDESVLSAIAAVEKFAESIID